MTACMAGGFSSDFVGFVYLYALVDQYDYNNYYCSQHIQSTDPSKPLVRLTFSTLVMESGDPCPDDLSVYDGPDDTAPLIGSYCGSQAQAPILSSGPDLFIEYQSDPDEESEFWIDWQFVGCSPDCGDHGSCTTSNLVGGDPVCECDANFSGERCDVSAGSAECACAVRPEDRVGCSVSVKGITKNQCIQGPDCCWEARKGYNYCFLNSGPDTAVPPEPGSCVPRPPGDARQNCGWPKISRDECLCLGCCFDRPWGEIWCYHPPSP